MKKSLTLSIALVITMCFLCPGRAAALDPNDFTGTWYSFTEHYDGTLVNDEGYGSGITLVLLKDYTGFLYIVGSMTGTRDEAITWGLGTGREQGQIWINTGEYYNLYLQAVDGRLIGLGPWTGVKLGRDIPPAGGHYRTDVALEDFNGSWAVDYVLRMGDKMSFEEFYTSFNSSFRDHDVIINALTIDNGKLTDSGSEGDQPFEGDVSLAKLAVERSNANGSKDTMSFSLHEDGLMSYYNRLGIFYYQQVKTLEPTPEPTLEPTPEPTTEPTTELPQEPSLPPDETPVPSEEPIPTPNNNGGGNGGPDWLVIEIIAFAVVAIGGIVTFTIVWNKK